MFIGLHRADTLGAEKDESQKGFASLGEGWPHPSTLQTKKGALDEKENEEYTRSVLRWNHPQRRHF